MSIEPRSRLQMIVIVFDPDTDGAERLKGAQYVTIEGMWDTEKPDPRPRDGFNAPLSLPPQTGFWAGATQPQTRPLAASDAQDGLPLSTMVPKIDVAALAQVNALNIELGQLMQDLQQREAMIGTHEATIKAREQTIAALQGQIAELSKPPPSDAVVALRSSILGGTRV